MRETKRRGPRRLLGRIAGVLLALVALVIVAVMIDAGLIAKRSLDGQQERLAARQAEVDALPEGVFAGWEDTSATADVTDDTPWNRLQSVATHNSYAVQPSPIQLGMLRIAAPSDAPTLLYSHPPLWEQFEQGVRSLELDLRIHRSGDLRLTHVPLLANGGNSPDFLLALDEIALWSSSHPGHLPITVLTEFKSDYAFLDLSLADFDAAALRTVDAAIRERIGEALLTPADLPDDPAAWPSLGELRGSVLFLMHPGARLGEIYAGQESPAMFAAAFPDDRTGARFLVHDSVDAAALAGLVAEGHVVRTRADADLLTDPTRRDEALVSGAQLISTDFPAPHSDGTGYTVGFDGGALTRVAP